jgi:hypothetical protein
MGKEATPRSRAEEARILDDIIKNIAAAASRGAGPAALFQNFANEEGRDGGGTISASSFTGQLARIGAKLNSSEENILLAKYTQPRSNGRIDYRAFCQELGNKGGSNRRPAVALTQGQEDMLRRAKEFLKDANTRVPRGEGEPQAKLMAEFKRKDRSG